LQSTAEPIEAPAEVVDAEASASRAIEGQSYTFDAPERDRVLKLRRGHLARRLWREFLEQTLRLGFLFLGDLLVTGLVVATLAAADVGAFVTEGIEAVLFLTLFLGAGQALAGTYGTDAAQRTLARVALGTSYGVGGLFFVGALYPAFALPWSGYLLIVALAVPGFRSWRSWLSFLLQIAHRWGLGRRRVLVIANDTQAKRIRDQLERTDDPAVRVVGHIAPEELGAQLSAWVSGAGILQRGGVEVVVLGSELRPAEFDQLVRACLGYGVTLSVVPGPLTDLPFRANGRRIHGWPEIRVRPPLRFVVQITLKRLIDIAGAAVGLILSAPFMLLIAVAIRLDSPGPIFFRQQRMGLGGLPFRIVKFRTMRPDAEEVLRKDPELYAKYLANDFKLPEGEDPRISRVGRFLRKTSLDELPQLINVLRGEMSLVGPRPVVGLELTHYGEHAETLLSVKPGITGYWQISGRSEIHYPERALLDLRYIENWSLLFDLRILLATIPFVLTRRGAH